MVREDKLEENKNLPELYLNDEVRLHDGNSWSIKGTVIEISKYPRSLCDFNFQRYKS